MNLHKLLASKNECSTVGRTIKPTGIMVHSTGANNPYLRRYVGPDDGIIGQGNNHWNVCHPGGKDIGPHSYVNKNGDGRCDLCGGTQVCVHAFIGLTKDNTTVATYQTLPWTTRGWHAGGGANNNYIGFEICEDDLTSKEYFDKVYKEAVELCAYLCMTYGIEPVKPNLICHSEGYKMGIASNHADVMHWFPKFGKSMDTFRKDVAEALNTPKLDNSPDPYAKDAVDWALNKRILLGNNSGDLMLHKPVTRQDMLVFLKRMNDTLKK